MNNNNIKKDRFLIVLFILWAIIGIPFATDLSNDLYHGYGLGDGSELVSNIYAFGLMLSPIIVFQGWRWVSDNASMPKWLYITYIVLLTCLWVLFIDDDLAFSLLCIPAFVAFNWTIDGSPIKTEKLENEKYPKPFHTNTNVDERREWFRVTKPWDKVHPKVIDALISKFGENPMFEAFVIASMGQRLVRRYEELDNQGLTDSPEIICSFISGILCTQGEILTAQAFNIFVGSNANEKKFIKVYLDAMNLLESSIIIDPNQVSAYLKLAGLKGMLNKKDEALSFAQQGLKAIQRIRESNVPFHMSNIPGIQDAAQRLDEIEVHLLELESNFS